MQFGPLVQRINELRLKSLIQWICREWVRKLSFNELDNNYSWPRWHESKDKLVSSKENRHWHNLRRSVLIYIYIYISFQFDYKYSSSCYSVFLLISRSPHFRVFFLFYTVFFLLSPPSTCRPGFWHWSLSHQYLPEVSGSSCTAENYYSSITSTLMRPES